jgi:nicotinamidase-related amidase
MNSIKIVCVDFQKDFTSPLGVCYRPRPCVSFIKSDIIPYFREHELKIAEIVSDYRLPRPGDEFECCVPGTSGYESEIPQEIKNDSIWVKSMNSPVWTRENAGQADKVPGLPYPNPQAFLEWLYRTIGRPSETRAVVLIGLTMDCCVLCTGQELRYRAYPVKFLIEGVDTFRGDQTEKASLLKSPASNWGQAINWQEFKRMIEQPG